MTTIDLYNVTSPKVTISQAPQEAATVSISRDDKNLVLGLSIGIPAAAVVVLLVVVAVTLKSSSASSLTAKMIPTNGATETQSLLQTVSSTNV